MGEVKVDSQASFRRQCRHLSTTTLEIGTNRQTTSPPHLSLEDSLGSSLVSRRQPRLLTCLSKTASAASLSQGRPAPHLLPASSFCRCRVNIEVLGQSLLGQRCECHKSGTQASALALREAAPVACCRQARPVHGACALTSTRSLPCVPTTPAKSAYLLRHRRC